MTEEQKQPVAKSIKERAAALITHEPRVLSPTEFYEFAKGAYVLLKEIANAPEPEPVGYLYTNVQSGESHVSDTDDDYRGPERALWHIEPVYRRAKGGEA